MAAETVTVRMSRSDGSTPWGFRLQGGHEYSSPLSIGGVTAGSLADRAGLKEGDRLHSLAGHQSGQISHKDAQEAIVRAGNNLDLVVQRTGGGSAHSWKPPVDSGVTVQKFQHTVHSSTGSSTAASEQYRAAPPAPAPVHQAPPPAQVSPRAPPAPAPVKVSLEHQTKEAHFGGHNMPARPYAATFASAPASQRSPGSYQHTHQTQVAHMQYNSPSALYSGSSAADAYLQQTGGLFGTDPSIAKPGGNEPAYLHSETLQLIKESEARPRSPVPPPPEFADGRTETLHHTEAAQQSDSFKRLTHALGGAPEPSKTFVSTRVFRLERSDMPEAPHHHAHPPQPAEGTPVCENCGRHILGVFCKAGEKTLHEGCFKCTTCGTHLKNIGFFLVHDKLYCDIHARQQKQDHFKPTPPQDPSAFLPRAQPPPAPRIEAEPPKAFSSYQPEILKPGPVRSHPVPHHATPLSPASRGVPTHHSYYSSSTTSAYNVQSSAPPPSVPSHYSPQAYAPPPQTYAPPPAAPPKAPTFSPAPFSPVAPPAPAPTVCPPGPVAPPPPTAPAPTVCPPGLAGPVPPAPAPSSDNYPSSRSDHQASMEVTPTDDTLSPIPKPEQATWYTPQGMKFKWPPEKAQHNVVPYWSIENFDGHAVDSRADAGEVWSYRAHDVEPRGHPRILKEELIRSARESGQRPHEQAQQIVHEALQPFVYEQQEETVELKLPEMESKGLQVQPYSYGKLLSPIAERTEHSPRSELRLLEAEAEALQRRFSTFKKEQRPKLELKLLDAEAENLKDQFEQFRLHDPKKTELKLLEEEAFELQQRFYNFKESGPKTMDHQPQLLLLQAQAEELQEQYDSLQLEHPERMELLLLQEEAHKLQERYKQMQEQHTPEMQLHLMQAQAEEIQKRYLALHDKHNPSMQLQLLHTQAEELHSKYIDLHKEAPLFQLSLLQNEAENLEKHGKQSGMELKLLQAEAEELQEQFKNLHHGPVMQLKLLQTEAEKVQQDYDQQHPESIVSLSLLQAEAEQLQQDYVRTKQHWRSAVHAQKQQHAQRHQVAQAQYQRTTHEPAMQLQLLETEAVTKSSSHPQAPPRASKAKTRVVIHQATTTEDEKLESQASSLVGGVLSSAEHELSFDTVVRSLEDLAENLVAKQTLPAKPPHPQITQFNTYQNGQYPSIEETIDQLHDIQQTAYKSSQYNSEFKLQRSRADAGLYAQLNKPNAQAHPLPISQSQPSHSIFALGVPAHQQSAFNQEHSRHEGYSMSSSTTKWTSQQTTGAQGPPARGATQPLRGKGILKQSHEVPRIPVCEDCQREIRGPFVLAVNKTWCPDHFVCANDQCRRKLLDIGFVEEKGKKYCEVCFEQYFAPKCAKCSRSVTGDCLNALEKQWHPDCFSCCQCHQPFGNASFFLEDGKPYCEKDWNQMFTTKCASCQFPIEAGDRWVEALNAAYHSDCFTCSMCQKNLEGQSFYAKGGRPYCKAHA